MPDPSGLCSLITLLRFYTVFDLPMLWISFILSNERLGKFSTFVCMPIFLATISKHLLSIVTLSTTLDISNQDSIDWETSLLTHSNCINVFNTSSNAFDSEVGSFENKLA